MLAFLLCISVAQLSVDKRVRRARAAGGTKVHKHPGKSLGLNFGGFCQTFGFVYFSGVALQNILWCFHCSPHCVVVFLFLLLHLPTPTSDFQPPLPPLPPLSIRLPSFGHILKHLISFDKQKRLLIECRPCQGLHQAHWLRARRQVFCASAKLVRVKSPRVYSFGMVLMRKNLRWSCTPSSLSLHNGGVL